ncbi:MAG: diaminopimelate decarboxylase [Clostridia bacterium]|nr:diaminopimelate decarboxylase [Clostridia bacterium]MDD4571740.1 diaminopimelate decarboxylase [Clostridia bacterium]
MSVKKLPCNASELEAIAKEFGTPFHIYSEKAIRENARKLHQAFSWAPAFREHYAIKALPNPYILKIMQEEGCGADCSSLPELILADKVGMKGEEICFTSNDTPIAEFAAAKELGAVLNLDDITHIDFIDKQIGLPELISFRYNPGPLREGGNAIIGNPEEAKYGLTHSQVFEAIEICLARGVKRFGMHTMIVSNELNVEFLIGTATMMFKLAVEIKNKTGVELEFVNLGGGIGIPYKPEEKDVDLFTFGKGAKAEYEKIMVPAGLDKVRICLESGRMMTGPYGWLVAKAIHTKSIYKNYIGLDACMAHLMRPALYGSYHHITVLGKEDKPLDHIYDVAGSLCENNDKFAVDRALPEINIGDTVVIHDTGAHGHAMGFNYNGKLRCQELLLRENGKVELIRRAETLDDLFATLDFSNL